MKTVFAEESIALKNPLGGMSTLTDLLFAILNVVMIIAVPIIVFFIIFSGFTYVTAQGNPEKVKLATRSLMYGIIGGVIILGASAITVIVENLVKAF